MKHMIDVLPPDQGMHGEYVETCFEPSETPSASKPSKKRQYLSEKISQSAREQKHSHWVVLQPHMGLISSPGRVSTRTILFFPLSKPACTT